MRNGSWLAAVSSICVLTASLAAETQTPIAGTAVTVLAREKTLRIENAIVENGDLWVPLERVSEITGFELKPQGLCAGETCIPLPADGSWMREDEGEKRFAVTRFAKRVDQKFATDEQQPVWSFSVVPESATLPLLAGEAPDFELADRQGKMVRLSDFRGKKVMLWAWASWCSCRFDLKGWQKVYEELGQQGFEIVAVAQDTGGMAVAAPWYDKAGVTFTALVDPNHTVSSLYQMVNVPTGVWIDERGHIVRLPEVAYSKQDKVLGQVIGDDRYALGVRDWVAKGSESSYVVSPQQLQEKIVVRTAGERLADAEFKLGTYFLSTGDKVAASRHWQAAQKLNPDSWNYHRQEWSFNKGTEMLNFLSKVRKLGDEPYYAPVEFPAGK